MAIKGNNFKDRILNSFDIFETHLNGHKDSEQHKQRRNAMSIFQENGLPTLKHEMWKYTNVGFLNGLDFDCDISEHKHEIKSQIVNEHKVDGLDNVVVLVNGYYNEDLSDFNSNLEIKSMKAAHSENQEDLDKYYNKYLKNEENVFSAINTALSFDGVFIKAKKGIVADNPIYILNIVDTQSSNQFKQT